MSMNISAVFQNWYDAEVKRKNNDFSQLRNTVYSKGNIVGDVVYFRKAGDGMASKHNPGSDVSYMNADFSQVSCKMEDWEAFDYADQPSKMKFNFDEASELADIASKACGRRQDQIIIDALKKSKTTKIGSATTIFNLDLLLAIKEYFDDNSVPEDDRFMLWTPNQKSQLLKETKATSSDYIDVKALVRGDIKEYLGFNFITIAGRKEGGLPRTSTSNNGFAYQKRHVGFADGKNISTSMDYIAQKRALQVGAEFSAASTIIDEVGVVPFETKIVQP